MEIKTKQKINTNGKYIIAYTKYINKLINDLINLKY